MPVPLRVQLLLLVQLELLEPVAAAANITESTLRAHQLHPRAAYKGMSFAHASANLNAQLQQRSHLVTRPCAEFSHDDLDAMLHVLAGHSEQSFADLYVARQDNRRVATKDKLSRQLEGERSTLVQLQAQNSTAAAAVDSMLRDRKCIEIVVRYAHHLGDAKREALHELVGALPLLPRPADLAAPVPESASIAVQRIVDRYAKQVRALECHVTVVDGCTGGDFATCMSVCPGAPDPPQHVIENCRATCEAQCSGSLSEPQLASTTVLDTSSQAQLPSTGAPAATDKPSDVDPPYWGDSWFVVMSRNSTLEDGSPGGFRACLRWYDWSRFSSRVDCTFEGATSSTLQPGDGKLYMVSAGPPFCVVADLEQTPVAPYWLQQDAVYLGTGVEHEVPVHIWDRREGPDGDAHIFKVAQSDGRPIQMLTTGPDLGRGRESNQKDYLNYIKQEIPGEVFDVPAACLDGRAKVVGLAEMLADPNVFVGL